MARIAHFIDTHHAGGAERVVVDLCSRLSQLGHSVEVMHFGNDWIANYARQRNFESFVLPHESWYDSKWTVAAFGVALAKILREHRVELLHSHLNGAVAAGSMAAMIDGIPHVGTLHDVYHVAQDPRAFRALRLAALCGSHLVTVSRDMSRFYQRLGSGRIQFDCIYNGVDTEIVKPKGAGSNKVFTLISVGRLVSLKGFDILLKALSHCGSGAPHLRIVGEGSGEPALRKQAESLEISSRVEFLGFREDVPELLAEADAFVLASRSEGLSCSIAEAMAAGLPCVVTDVGGNRELVVEGETGFLIRPEDWKQLASRIQQLAGDRELARQMGNAARMRAVQHFSVDVMTRNYEQIYSANLMPPTERARLRGSATNS